MRFLVLYSLLLSLLPAGALAQGFGLLTRSNEMLRMVRHDVEVAIHHPVAETTVTQEFYNPHHFNMEAFFTYPVPVGATVTGMALWVNGVRREARMIERQKAREIYDQITSKQRDPAILERLDGNTFRIRVFPILPRSRHRVELRFVQPVAQQGADRYSYTLRHPPGQAPFDIGLSVRLKAPPTPLQEVRLTGYRGQLSLEGDTYVLPMAAAKQRFKEDIQLVYRLHSPLSRSVAATLDHHNRRLVFAEVPLGVSRARPLRTALLVDDSRSMAAQRDRIQELVARLLGSRPPDVPLAVSPFDILPRRAIRFPPAEDQHLTDAAALRGSGGTAFIPVVTQAAAAGARHLILLTDGGTPYHQGELERLLRILHDRPHLMVSVIAPAGGPNEQLLVDLTTLSGGVFVSLKDATDGAALTRQLLTRQRTPEALLHGGEVRVVRREAHRLLLAGALPLDEIPPGGAGRLTLDGEDYALDLRPREPPVSGVGGLWAAAEIEHRMRLIRVQGETEEGRAGVVRLSKEHNVLSEYTALLATETDADFERPTSGRKWQRRMSPSVEDDLPSTSFSSTPEPHEIALCLLALLMLAAARRRGRHAGDTAAGGAETGSALPG